MKTTTVYDKNGQPYEADLVSGEEYRRLEAEVAEAKRGCKMLADNATHWKEARDECERQFQAKVAEIAELLDDSAMLDWLLGQGLCWRDCDKEVPAEHWVVGPQTEWLYRNNGGRGRIQDAMDRDRNRDKMSGPTPAEFEEMGKKDWTGAEL